MASRAAVKTAPSMAGPATVAASSVRKKAGCAIMPDYRFINAAIP
jgi:hypothetical protein